MQDHFVFAIRQLGGFFDQVVNAENAPSFPVPEGYIVELETGNSGVNVNVSIDIYRPLGFGTILFPSFVLSPGPQLPRKVNVSNLNELWFWTPGAPVGVDLVYITVRRP